MNLLFQSRDRNLIQRLCHRRFGIGADGLILLQPSRSADFRMRVFNSDGGEPEMCGNGIRCLVHFIHSLGYNLASYWIETMHSNVQCHIQHEKIFVSQKISGAPAKELQMSLKDTVERIWILNTGVPHAVVFKDAIESIDLDQLGREIRFHKDLGPEGANVSFAKVLGSSEVEVRTYERGVEAETFACGTAAVAVSLVAHQKYFFKSPIKIIPLSKEMIEVKFSEIHAEQREIQVAGNAKFVFNGQVHI